MVVEIRLLGGFDVEVDGVPAPADGWRRRQAAALVKLLALAPQRTLHRERVIDALWPDLSVEEAAPRLHKAAHYARKVLGHHRSLLLGGDAVALFPDLDVVVDVHRFDAFAARAVTANDKHLAHAALAIYGGELLPGDIYESWTHDERERLRLRHAELLRYAERWEELLTDDPADEDAHIGLMRRYAAQGDRRLALRQFERMDNALRRELGVGPPAAAVALRDQLLAASDVAPSEPVRMQRTMAGPDGPEQLVGRAAQTARVEGILATGAAGAGHVVFVHGPAGVGKTALLHWAEHRARALSWHTGTGAAAEIEGAWPYAPVVEALSDLCRRHPEILEELDDRFRAEIDRVLSGRVLDWNGEGAHQQLFVAAVELLRLASTTTPVLLVVDDVHEADQASLRLLHYLARSTGDLPVVLLLGHRSEALSNELAGVRDSLLSRAAAMDIILGPLDAESATTLVRQIMAANAADKEIEEVAALSRGFPFVATELAQAAVRGSLWTDVSGAVLRGLPAPTRGTLEQVALVGATFSTDEFLDLAATDTDRAYADLDAALSARVRLERTEGGYRFRHPLVRDALVAALTPQQARAAHRHAADRLAAKGGSPARIGYHLMNAGESAEAVPYVTRAAQTAAAMGAYGDALDLVESIRAHVHGPDEALVLRIRADLLVALGDAGAIPAYRQALAVTNGEDQRLVRAKLARAAVIAGDLDLAATALDGLEPDGGPADGPLLVAIGMSAYFAGDINRADAAAGEARRRVLDGDMSQHLLDLLTLQGLIAHNRGEWFDRLRLELRTTQDNAELAVAVFDSHLCVAEYLLYGPTPYEEVVAMAEALRATGRRTGALRAVAFAAALTGEAALLSGDLERAGQELREAADLHHDIGAPAGEALSLQRLAEVRLAQGDRTEANRLLQRALILARWSPMAPHLLQRTFGTMIEAAPDAEAALAMVDRAEGALADRDLCPFCDVMLAVPAAIACSRAGDIERAHRYLRAAEGCAARWVGTAWEAAVLEARGHLAWAEGDTRRGAALLAHATEQFEAAEQPRDAGRCRQTLKTMTASAAESDQ